jgi:hypothetical protein
MVRTRFPGGTTTVVPPAPPGAVAPPGAIRPPGAAVPPEVATPPEIVVPPVLVVPPVPTVPPVAVVPPDAAPPVPIPLAPPVPLPGCELPPDEELIWPLLELPHAGSRSPTLMAHTNAAETWPTRRCVVFFMRFSLQDGFTIPSLKEEWHGLSPRLTFSCAKLSQVWQVPWSAVTAFVQVWNGRHRKAVVPAGTSQPKPRPVSAPCYESTSR